MNIKQTKEQIATLLDGQMVGASLCGMDTSDIKALATSHTELLDAAKAVRDEIHEEGQCTRQSRGAAGRLWVLLDDAIERAEGVE